jgi:hypothetical protein
MLALAPLAPSSLDQTSLVLSLLDNNLLTLSSTYLYHPSPCDSLLCHIAAYIKPFIEMDTFLPLLIDAGMAAPSTNANDTNEEEPAPDVPEGLMIAFFPFFNFFAIVDA